MTPPPKAEALSDGLRAVLGNTELSDEIKIALLNQQFDREKFISTQALEGRRWLYSTPVAVALAGGITILLNWYFSSLTNDQQSTISAQSAAKEFQYGILKSELEKESTAQQKADALLFLAKAGLLDDLNVTYLIEVAQKAPDKIPQLGSIDRSTETSMLKSVYTVDDIIEVIFSFEGGYVDDPNGATNMGITVDMLSSWRGKPVTKEELRDLPREEAQAFYRDLITHTGADQIENVFLRTAYVMAAVSTGSSRAIRLLQKLVDEIQDGMLGPRTLSKANDMARANERETVIQFNCGLLEYYRGTPFWDKFGRGWSRRVSEVTPGGDLSVCDAGQK